MIEKNSLPVGLLVGLLLPLIGYLILTGVFIGLENIGWMSDSGFRPKFRERTIGIIALALNAIALNYYQKRYYNNSVRGVVVMTAIYIGLWLYLYGEYVL
ncbi:MAG: hypothetical protein AAFZ15_18415 [Bacteroidota bacterium]